MSLSNTLLKVRLPSGGEAVYDVQPQHLTLRHYDATLASNAREHGTQLWHSKDGRWYEAAGPLRSAWHAVTDAKTIALLERMPLTD
ncbi:MAG: hypothetical protein RIS35_2463 [Pseudomonadota bacterium]|jgi:hypothetical protein